MLSATKYIMNDLQAFPSATRTPSSSYLGPTMASVLEVAQPVSLASLVTSVKSHKTKLYYLPTGSLCLGAFGLTRSEVDEWSPCYSDSHDS